MSKRLFDIALSLFGVVVLSPLLLGVSLAIILDSGMPILYRQERIGKNGIPFQLYKFRSMKTDNAGLKITLANDPRVTAVGRFIRKYKIDEFPQFLNILKGDMSFVGPRPEVEHYVKHYSAEQRKVLGVKPGLTGLDSLNFSNEADLLKGKTDPENYYIQHIMPVKLEYNLKYIHKKSLWFDVKVIFKTIGKILS
ncbi:MAG: sugar transferase [Flavobacteriales bacterium]